MFKAVDSSENSPNSMWITLEVSIFEHNIVVDFEKGVPEARLFYNWRARPDWWSYSKTQRGVK